ncbi:hypothetical protein DP144_01755 [Clostridium tetani]|uniref:hypothetical protein n=1 Tax=Clostridium tetani TaxID=1513 RepID=UPI00100C0DE5|nr:hypothetical protein [Clostridium tetani]RXM79559.1 hypothetical protein DP154_01755 [Clostridium tetani]RYV00372.1 hypothetical protein DP144_01755 [Clostridium tetani]
MKICFIYSNAKVEKFKRKQKIKYNSNLELLAKHINQDSKLKRQTIFILGSLLYVQEVVNAATDTFGKIDKAGSTILGIVRKIGYWICIVGCILDIIKALMQGDTRNVAKIMMKYALAFSALYVFPWILDLIKSIF